jgi:hypothetical protein
VYLRYIRSADPLTASRDRQEANVAAFPCNSSREEVARRRYGYLETNLDLDSESSSSREEAEQQGAADGTHLSVSETDVEEEEPHSEQENNVEEGSEKVGVKKEEREGDLKEQEDEAMRFADGHMVTKTVSTAEFETCSGPPFTHLQRSNTLPSQLVSY